MCFHMYIFTHIPPRRINACMQFYNIIIFIIPWTISKANKRADRAFVNYIRKIKLCSALTESARLLISPGASAINESFTFTCINLVKVLCKRTFQRVTYDSTRHQDHAILLNGGLLLSSLPLSLAHSHRARARTTYSRVAFTQRKHRALNGYRK